MADAGFRKAFAKAYIKEALRGKGTNSLLTVFKQEAHFSSTRNRNEALLLANAIDQLQLGNVRTALELLCRRLAGVHIADSTDNWNICDAIEMRSDKRTFMPEDFLRRALKTSAQIEAAHRSAHSSANFRPASASSSSGGGARASGGPKKPQASFPRPTGTAHATSSSSSSSGPAKK